LDEGIQTADDPNVKGVSVGTGEVALSLDSPRSLDSLRSLDSPRSPNLHPHKTPPGGVVGPQLWKSGVILGATYVYVLGFFLLTRRVVEFCSNDYFAILMIYLAVTAIAIAKIFVRTWRNYTSLLNQHADSDTYDFKYPAESCYNLAKEMVHIGCLVGFFRVDTGIGLYLPMAGNNSRPQVMVATCAFIMLMYSSMTVTTFATMDLIRLDYGLWFFFIGLIGGALGYGAILLYWRKMHQYSIAYTLVGSVVAVLLSLVFITDMILFVEEWEEGTFQWNFVDPCIPIK
jgi:uncharacterized membrane protein YfcA